MLKTLAGSLREYKKSSFAAIFFSVIEVIFEIVIPLCMSNLIDNGIEKSNMSMVWKFGILLLVFALLQLATGMLSAYTAAKAATGFSANLRQDMYDNMQTFAFSNIDRFSTASIVTRLTTDVSNVQNAYQMLIKLAVRGPVMLIVSMIVSFRINRQISLIFLAIVPVLGVLLALIVRKVHPVFEKVFHTYDDLNNVVQEDLRGIRVVKSCNREDLEISKFKKISQDIYKGFAKAEQMLALNSPLMQICMYTCMILTSWIGAKAIVASGNNTALGLTTGDLTALITYSIQILSSLMMLSMILVMLTMAQASGKRICEVLGETSSLHNPENPVYEVPNGAVDFDHVQFKYSASAKRSALSNIDFHVKSGQTVGIIGGTGSAKTTLVQLICRLYDVTDGSVKVGGRDVRAYDLETLRNQVAVVLQKLGAGHGSR